METRTSDRIDVPGCGSRRAAVALVTAVVLGSILVACEGEQGADDRPKAIVMDDFESGGLAEWQAVGSGSGAWFVYSDGRQAPDPDQSDPNAPFHVPDPPQGGFAAVTDMSGPGTRILLPRRCAGRSIEPAPDRLPRRERPVQQPGHPGL